MLNGISSSWPASSLPAESTWREVGDRVLDSPRETGAPPASSIPESIPFGLELLLACNGVALAARAGGRRARRPARSGGSETCTGPQLSRRLRAFFHSFLMAVVKSVVLSLNGVPLSVRRGAKPDLCFRRDNDNHLASEEVRRFPVLHSQLLCARQRNLEGTSTLYEDDLDARAGIASFKGVARQCGAPHSEKSNPRWKRGAQIVDHQSAWSSELLSKPGCSERTQRD